MKVGVVTVHRANNYGAVLQAYALQYVLNENGIDAMFVDYVGDFLKHPFGIENFKKKGIMGEVLTFAGELSRLPRKKKFDKFREEYLKCTESMKKGELYKLERYFDLFIAGSDQIWNYKITNLDSVYLLDFVSNYNKKGSYAASFGLTQIEKKYRNWYSKYLKDIKYLNVREKSAIPMVKKYTGRYPNIVLDPTLLVEKHKWEKLSIKPNVSGEYILSYQVGMDGRLIEYIKYLSEHTGLPVYSIPFPQGGYVKSHAILDAGPREWLGWIENAKYVITDSFHGMALSIVFEREFFVNISSRGKVLSSRLKDLMDILGIENRNIDEIGDNPTNSIDYKSVNKRLEKLKKQSMKILMGMVDDAKGEKK